VDWEIDATLDKEHGLIGICLPTAPRNAENKIIVPDRLHDNIQSGFVLWRSRNDFTANTTKLQQDIAIAKSRSTKLIVNNTVEALSK
jgi:MTH538 TIR-like domain (DUF1863)